MSKTPIVQAPRGFRGPPGPPGADGMQGEQALQDNNILIPVLRDDWYDYWLEEQAFRFDMTRDEQDEWLRSRFDLKYPTFKQMMEAEKAT